MTPKVNILNVSVDNLNQKQTVEKIKNAIEGGKQVHHVVVNAGKLVSM